MRPFARRLLILSWILYGIGVLIVICRGASRRIQVGSFRKFQSDDWIMLLALCTFTGVIVTANETSQHSSNYSGRVLNPAEIPEAIYGSKMLLLLEEFTLCTLWLVKACMLILYNRFTLVLRRNLIVKILAWYCVLGFLITQVLFLGVWCRPLKAYWRVPLNNEQCATYHRHMITASFFNISSDLVMLFIPLPLLITSRLPLKRKLILCAVFSLGIFVTLAAILNRYFNFAHPESPIFFNWYVGEVSSAIYVSNIPLCWPLVRRLFSLGDFGSSPPPLQMTGSTSWLSPVKGSGSPGKGFKSDITATADREVEGTRDPWIELWGSTDEEVVLVQHYPPPTTPPITAVELSLVNHSSGESIDLSDRQGFAFMGGEGESLKNARVSQHSSLFVEI